jgi:neutral ceramidase
LLSFLFNALNFSTGPAAQVNMMGYAKPEQTTAGIHQRLRARAFIIGREATDGLLVGNHAAQPPHATTRTTMLQRVRLRWNRPTVETKDAMEETGPYRIDPDSTICFVSLDVGMGSDLLNLRVLKRLAEELPVEAQGLCRVDNLSISGTHTHSAPGGYLQYVLYQLTGTGFVQETMDALVEGTAQALLQAFEKLQPGRLSLSQGQLRNASINRSPTSYLLNPLAEREEYRHQGDTDKTMVQLLLEPWKNETLSGDVRPPLGFLNWFAVHGTSMNGTNQLISGDNKGYASYLMERHMDPDAVTGHGSFVAAFASTNLGDVSPNLAGPRCLDSGLPCDLTTSTCHGQMNLCVAFGPGQDMFESTEIIGRRQFDKSLGLLEQPSSSGDRRLLEGTIRSRHAFVDMSLRNVTLSNGTTVHTCPAALGLSFAGGTMDGAGGLDFRQGMNTSHPFWAMVFGHLSLPSPAQVACQAPKPIMLNTGRVKLPYDWDPNTVPISIFQVGSFFILNVPCEFTTMAGRRLRKAVEEVLVQAGVPDPVLTIAGLTNSYTHYVTTYEEYQAQRYEAASTLYGPYTLDTYLQEFRRLAADLVADRPSLSDAAPRDLTKRQISLQSPVELDTIAPGRKFGELVRDAEDSYLNTGNETVRVVFRSANPRNNQRIQGTFLTVDHLVEHGVWKTIFTDGDWDTRFYWRSSFGMSFADIHWRITPETSRGLYRVCHYGTRKRLLGDVEAFLYYAPEWFTISASGSIGANLMAQAVRLGVALSESLRTFLGFEGRAHRVSDFVGCSKTFLVDEP